MERIYIEFDEKSGNYQLNSPCVKVIVFKPETPEEEALPAIIALQAGRLGDCSDMVVMYTTYHFEHWHYNESVIIRKAIKLFDKFKRKSYKLAEAGID